MIKRFLSLSVEKRARLIIWLYFRYVEKPAIEELERLIEEEEDRQFATVFEPDFEKPVIH